MPNNVLRDEEDLSKELIKLIEIKNYENENKFYDEILKDKYW